MTVTAASLYADIVRLTRAGIDPAEILSDTADLTCRMCGEADAEPVEILDGDRVIATGHQLDPDGNLICSDCHADLTYEHIPDPNDPQTWGLDPDAFRDLRTER